MGEAKFETAYKKLESIVDQLESGDLELDQALKLYEEGIRHSRLCAKKLETAQKRVQKLSRSPSGELETEDLDLFASSETAGDAES